MLRKDLTENRKQFQATSKNQIHFEKAVTVSKNQIYP